MPSGSGADAGDSRVIGGRRRQARRFRRDVGRKAPKMHKMSELSGFVVRRREKLSRHGRRAGLDAFSPPPAGKVKWLDVVVVVVHTGGGGGIGIWI